MSWSRRNSSVHPQAPRVNVKALDVTPLPPPLKAIVYPARLPLGRIGEAGWVSMTEIDQRS